MNMTRRYLGVDYGSKRIGLAVSDQSNQFAFPLCVLQNTPDLFDNMSAILEKNNIGDIVVGESRDFKQKENDIMEGARAFAKEIKKRFGISAHFHPEFMTSQEAERTQGKNDMLDASAAALILKSYLDTHYDHN